MYEDIIQYGSNLTYEGWKDAIKENIREKLAESIQDYTWKGKSIIENISSSTIDSIMEEMLDCGLCDCDTYQGAEDEYGYEYDCDLGKIKLELFYLGGYPLISVLKSPFYTLCKKCSPCCFNAGDLDSPDDSGIKTYCLPLEDMPDSWEEKSILVVPENINNK